MIPKDVLSIKEIIKNATMDIMRAGEEVAPQAFLFAKNVNTDTQQIIPIVGISTFFKSSETKQKIPIVIQNVWESLKQQGSTHLEAVLLMSDAWFATKSYLGKTEEEIRKIARGLSASEQPDRREAINFMIYTPDERRAWYYEYFNSADGVVWGEVIEFEPDDRLGILRDVFPRNL